MKTEPEVYAEYTKVTGSAYDGSDYTYASFFPAVLSNLGLGNWEALDIGRNSFAAAAKSATAAGAPVIGLVQWAGRGAHFVLIDEFHGDKACVCDPWDGHLHVTKMTDGGPVTYNAGEQVVGWSIGGKKHTYPQGQTGTFNGWIVRRK